MIGNKISTYPVLVAFIVIIVIVEQIDARKDGVHHCNDKVRELILDSCKNLNMAYKSRRDRQTHIVKRENEVEVDDDASAEFIENETIMDILKGHRLYNVRKSSFPEGAHLILSHRNAKILREYDSKYKIDPRPMVYHNVNGRMERVQMNRHRRNSQKHGGMADRISACCFTDISCMTAMCTAKP